MLLANKAANQRKVLHLILKFCSPLVRAEGRQVLSATCSLAEVLDAGVERLGTKGSGSYTVGGCGLSWSLLESSLWEEGCLQHAHHNLQTSAHNPAGLHRVFSLEARGTRSVPVYCF